MVNGNIIGHKMSYHKNKKKIKEYNQKWITIIGVVFSAMVGLKVLGQAIENDRFKDCYQYPYRQISGYLECKKHNKPVIWVDMTELQKERNRLFELARQGNKRAKKKLNKLNYDEENRKQNRK